MDLIIFKQAQKELKNTPKDIIEDTFALFEDLMEGHKLSMPISRPLFSITKGLYELRLSGRSGEFRVFYVIRPGEAIYVIHAETKKKQELDKRVRQILQTRIRSLNL